MLRFFYSILLFIALISWVQQCSCFRYNRYEKLSNTKLSYGIENQPRCRRSVSRIYMFQKLGNDISDIKYSIAKQLARAVTAVLLIVLPITHIHDNAMALNMGTLFEREEVTSDEETVDFVGIMRQLMKNDVDSVEEEEEMKNEIESDNSINEKLQDNTDEKSSTSTSLESDDDSVPPVSRGLFNRILQGDKTNLKKTLFDTSNDLGVGEGLISGEGLESKDSPPRGLPSFEFLEEKAMFEEVVGEVSTIFFHLFKYIYLYVNYIF